MRKSSSLPSKGVRGEIIRHEPLCQNLNNIFQHCVSYPFFSFIYVSEEDARDLTIRILQLREYPRTLLLEQRIGPRFIRFCYIAELIRQDVST